jgi:hypothetical protein
MNALTAAPPAAAVTSSPAVVSETRSPREDIAPAAAMLNFLAAAMTNPKISAEKLKALLDMQREVVADAATLQFNRAMSAVQAEMQPVLHDATNEQTRSKYSRLETIDALMRPIYSRHGFSLSFDSEPVAAPNVRIPVRSRMSPATPGPITSTPASTPPA